MANKPGKGILLTTKFYKSANDAALLDPDKRNKEGKADAHPERMAVNKQENTTTKKSCHGKFTPRSYTYSSSIS